MIDNGKLLRHSFLELLGNSGWKDYRHLKTCVDMLIGLILSGTVSLTKWIPYAKARGALAQSVQRRFIRWLENSQIQVSTLYEPLIREALSEWGDAVVYLALDASTCSAQVLRCYGIPTA